MAMSPQDRFAISVLAFIMFRQALSSKGVPDGEIIDQYRNNPPPSDIKGSVTEALRALKEQGYIRFSGGVVTITVAGACHVTMFKDCCQQPEPLSA